MPKWLIEHPLVRHFIRGYIDGDGSICSSIRKRHLYPQISLSLIGNYDVMQDINNIFIRDCNIGGSKITHKPNTKHTYRIRYGGNAVALKLGHFLYDDATIYLERKYNKISPVLLKIAHKVR